MEYFKYAYNKEYNSYKYVDSNSLELTLLASFLRSDVKNVPGWKEWALDPTQTSTTSNFAYLAKENGLILIGDQCAEDLDNQQFCKIPLDEFIKILDQWEQFCKTKPKEILITRENDTFKIKALD